MLPILVIDLFCGIGGFSTGAIQAGANVILAVDMWNDAIVIHTKNHPNTTHWVEELGGDCNIFMEKMQQFSKDFKPKLPKLTLVPAEALPPLLPL